MKLADLELSKSQERALIKLVNSGQWESAYSLQESLTTLDSLVHKKLAKRNIGLGAGFSPRTSISFKALVKYRSV